MINFNYIIGHTNNKSFDLNLSFIKKNCLIIINILININFIYLLEII